MRTNTIWRKKEVVYVGELRRFDEKKNLPTLESKHDLTKKRSCLCWRTNTIWRKKKSDNTGKLRESKAIVCVCVCVCLISWIDEKSLIMISRKKRLEGEQTMFQLSRKIERNFRNFYNVCFSNSNFTWNHLENEAALKLIYGRIEVIRFGHKLFFWRQIGRNWKQSSGNTKFRLSNILLR